MKYLIDGVTKSVLSLANQYKNLRQEDEYKVFDDTFSNIENLDLAQINNFYIDENGERIELDQADNDSRRMKMTNDFDSALEWCDCYVTFRSIPYELTNINDLGLAEEQLDSLLERIQKAQNLGKKIYLGNRFSSEFAKITTNYEKCINPHITKKELNEIKDYSFFHAGTFPFAGFNTTMIVGTNSSSGKFSCALKAKKYYEDLGEKVVLIHTEETYPFLDDQGGTIYGFCRNFSDLTTDEDLMYFQSLVAKIYNEQRPERIIFVTQAGFGIDGIINSYQDTDNGRKMKGLWDVFITRSFGVNQVIISANCNRLEIVKKLIEYFRIQNSIVDVPLIFINPREYSKEDTIIYTKDDKSEFFKTVPKCSNKELELSLNGIALEYPEIDIQCDYNNLTEKIKEFKNNDDFRYCCAGSYASKVMGGLKQRLSAEGFADISEEIKKKIKEQYSNYSIPKSDLHKIEDKSNGCIDF